MRWPRVGGGAGLGWRAWALAVVATAAATPAAAAAAAVTVTVDCDTGPAVTGVFRAIDASAVTLDIDGEARVLPRAEVRSVVRTPATPPRPEPASVHVGGDGIEVAGDDLLWEGDRIAIIRGVERVELPVDRVGRAVWRTAAGAGEPAWLAAVPAAPAADLVAVSRAGGFELVECAITGITSDAVEVMLDGERIPVKRGKVLGLVWLRPQPPAARPGVHVAIPGGRLAATTIVGSDDGLLLDDTIRVPVGLLEAVDFTAGRRVSLVDLPLDDWQGEPFFGAAAAVEGMADFFAPRIVRPAAAAPAWLLRPSGAATWRIPGGSRRFRARLVATAVPATQAVEVVVRPDVGAAWQRRLEGGDAADVAVDLGTSRRLTIELRFADGGIGFPVRIVEGAFER